MEFNFKEVLTLFHEGQISKAKDICLKILKKEPNNIDILNLLGAVAFQDKNYSEAVYTFNKIIQINSNNFQAFYNQGNAYLGLKKFEEALTRIDSTTGKWYDVSAHMLWIGDRTRQLEGAHVEFMKGISNPIGIKVGPSINIDELLKIIETLNTKNNPDSFIDLYRIKVDNPSNYSLPRMMNLGLNISF